MKAYKYLASLLVLLMFVSVSSFAQEKEMTEEEWQNLYENFETIWLLDAVDRVDDLRVHLGDGEHFEPPDIRTDLLKLHGLAMDVVNNGREAKLEEMAELAVELEMQTLEMKQSLDALHQILSKLAELLPDDAFHANV